MKYLKILMIIFLLLGVSSSVEAERLELWPNKDISYKNDSDLIGKLKEELDKKDNKSSSERLGVIHYHLGDAYIRFKNYDKARIEFDKALIIAPNGKGKIYGQVVSLTEQIKIRMGEERNKLVNDGKKQLKRHQYVKGLHTMKCALNMLYAGEIGCDIYPWLGFAYAMCDSSSLSQKYYNLAERNCSNLSNVRLVLSSCYYNQGNYIKAKEHSTFLIEKVDNQNPNYRFQRGKCYYALADYSEAIKDLEIAKNGLEKRGIPNNMQYVVVLDFLGKCYFQQKKYDKALDSFELASEYKPDNPNIWRNIGVAYLEKGQCQPAIYAFKKSIELEKNAKVYRLLGDSYLLCGQVAAARDAYSNAEELEIKN